MKKHKILRILLWSLGGLTVTLAAVYLLRWPLFEGTVRSKISELVGKELNSEAQVEVLEGSLVRSITARDIKLKPKGGAPIQSATVDRVRVVYGFLGSGEPSLEVEDARIVLAAKDGPAPPLHETIHGVVRKGAPREGRRRPGGEGRPRAHGRGLHDGTRRGRRRRRPRRERRAEGRARHPRPRGRADRGAAGGLDAARGRGPHPRRAVPDDLRRRGGTPAGPRFPRGPSLQGERAQRGGPRRDGRDFPLEGEARRRRDRPGAGRRRRALAGPAARAAPAEGRGDPRGGEAAPARGKRVLRRIRFDRRRRL